MRLLELEVLHARYGDAAVLRGTITSIVDVDQFHGIEVEEWPAQIAQVAMWLTDHQMNLRVSEAFGQTMIRLPLTVSPHIVHGNALAMDWAQVVDLALLWFIVGNPPFVGHQWRNAQQMADMARVWGTGGRFRRLDYVTCWYRLAAQVMAVAPHVKAAFVSTNSIAQGEQVGTLWGDLLPRGIQIIFAHRTFQWTSEARGRAAVHCVIIGFQVGEPLARTLFDYAHIRAEPVALPARNINPYLVDGPTVLLPSRTETPVGLPPLYKGSQPTDGLNLILDEPEREALIFVEPGARRYLRPYVGGEELVHGQWRWCLWLKDADPAALRRLPEVQRRLAAVRAAREASATASVREYAQYPALFTQDRQPNQRYLAIPEVTSENRRYIPMSFLDEDVIASNKLQIIPGADLYLFGILTSAMHMAWVRAVCGRLKSDYSYAPALYNNFPWPDPTPAQRAAIEARAQGILDARAAHPGATLADLYDPNTMPPNLVQAHAALDRAVDAAYGPPRGGWAREAERVAFLFTRYQGAAAPLDIAPVRRGRRTPRAR